jgi:hypothetical protein
MPSPPADPVRRRAPSVDELNQLFERLLPRESVAAAIASWRPRPSDVVIAPFAKCGTTWLQQTFHTLRTRGDMDFDDISRVVPWIETASALGIDLEAPQRGEPRGFKSHLAFTDLPKGARAIVALRDPKDALVSVYRFMEGWFFEPGAISIEQFAPTRLDGPATAGYWGHLLSWWAQRDNPDVLLLSYEHMSDAPELNIRRVAAFCGIELDDELLQLTLERTSLGYMLRHKDRFDDMLMRDMAEAVCHLPPGGDSSKVRQGKVGTHHQELPASISAAVDARWREHITSQTGFADYAALEGDLRRHWQASSRMAPASNPPPRLRTQ